MKKQTKKEYCVHLYQRYDIENIMAKNKDEAIRIAMKREAIGWDELNDTEVMRTCSCGLDNELENKKCDDCGKKL